MLRIIFIFLACMLTSLVLVAQDSGKAKTSSLDWIVDIGIPAIIAFLAYLAAIVSTRKKIKDEVDREIREKAKTYVDELFSERLQVDPKMVGAFFRKLEKDNEKVAGKTIIIVSSDKASNQLSLFESLREQGFKVRDSKDITTDSIAQMGELIVFNNYGQELTPAEIDAFAEKTSKRNHFFYFGKEFTGNTRMKNFANGPATLGQRLREAILE